MMLSDRAVPERSRIRDEMGNFDGREGIFPSFENCRRDWREFSMAEVSTNENEIRDGL